MENGWCLDITTRGKTHYYKDGKSLCGKAKQKFHMTPHENSYPSIWQHDCSICINRLLTHNKKER